MQDLPIAAVTGVNGYIGTHCALCFLQQGWALRGSARSEEKRQIALNNPCFEEFHSHGRYEVVVVEDLAKPGAFLDHITALAHIATESAVFLPTWKQGREKTLRDIEGILNAAQHVETLRAVCLMSSKAATDEGKEGCYVSWTDEDCERTPDEDPLVLRKRYGRSKVIMEHYATDFHTKTKAKWSLSILCPSMTLGAVLDQYYRQPADIEGRNQSLTVKRLYPLLAGGDTTFSPYQSVTDPGSWVDARDVAQAVYKACQNKVGGRFIVESHVLSWAYLASRLAILRPDLIPRIPRQTTNSHPDRHPSGFNPHSVEPLGVKYHSTDEMLTTSFQYIVQLLGQS